MSWLDDLFHDAECVTFKANPVFWEGVLAVQTARSNGAITSVDQCKKMAADGDAIFGGDGLIGGGGDCICEFVFNQPGGAPPLIPFQTRIFQSATTFVNENDGTWLMADFDRDGIPDLVFIKTNNTGDGHVEVHIASGASNYQTRIFESATTFVYENDGTWLMADFDRDGIPDLVFIKTNNTGDGHVEVHIASGASNYQTRIFESATTFVNENDGTWLMADFDRDGIPDLVFIKTNNTGDGHVEVHIASGASNYQTRMFESATTFVNENDGTWLMADFDRDGIPDLVFIKTNNTGDGHVEVHVAPGSSNYQNRFFESATTFLNEDDGTWLMADFDRDGIPDLIFIKTNSTPNGHVEVHIASGA